MSVSLQCLSIVLCYHASLVLGAASAYKLTKNYTADNFLSDFNFFNGPDPSHGSVRYRNRSDAEALNLVGTRASRIVQGAKNVYFGAYESVLDASHLLARPSVRLESKRLFKRGLFIADIVHQPVMKCGIWPAFWMSPVDGWPVGGEIDIVEGVNEQQSNHMYLHTAGKCQMDAGFRQSKIKTGSTNCQVSKSPTGCGIIDPVPGSYGAAWNAQLGGVYAMQWTLDFLAFWWWPRRDVPRDITAGKPDPGTWSTPVALFKGNCSIDREFQASRIIFDVTFCGDWAAGPFTWNRTCAAKHGSSCLDYTVKQTYPDAYWELASLAVFDAA